MLFRDKKNKEEFAALISQFKDCYLKLPSQGSKAMYGVFVVNRDVISINVYTHQTNLKFRPCTFWDGEKGKLLTPNDQIELTPDQLEIFIGK